MKPLAPTLAAFLGGICLLGSSAHAQNNWYLHAGQGGSDDWNTLADWWSSPLTSSPDQGTHPTAISASDNFYSNGLAVRTPNNSSAAPFGGASLTMDGGELVIKDDSSSTLTSITNFISDGSNMANASGGTQQLSITNFTDNSFTVIDSGGSSRNLNLTVGTLTGTGNLDFIDGGIIYLSVTGSAANFTGTIYTDAAATLELQTNLNFSGTFAVGSNSKVVLNGSVTCNALTFDGTPYNNGAAGTYSVATLSAAYPAIFTSGSGSITVRPPVTYDLHASEGGTDDWNTLADWWSTPTGGTHPTAINPWDDFSTNNFYLRTPSTRSATTFGGAVLDLTGGTGSVLLLKGIGTAAVTTIGSLFSTGGAIANGSGGALPLDIGNFVNSTGTMTFESDASNRGFALSVGTLMDDSTLAVLDGSGGALAFDGDGGGTLSLSITDASDYTGTITLSSSSTGTTTFASPLFTPASLVVGAGNSVVVNAPIILGALTVGSTVKGYGTYTASSLGFTGSGSVTVQPHEQKLFGVNFAGGTGDTGPYFATESDYQYFSGKNQKLERLGIKWEYIQKTLDGALDPTNLAALDNQVALAAKYGIKVFLDIHSYGAYNGNDIGSSAVPESDFANLWTQLATHYKGNTAIYGYDLMNEPADSEWPTAAQDAINAIRAVDTSVFILVEGLSSSSASGWPGSNRGFPLSDPSNRIIYSAHFYPSNSGYDKFGTYNDEGSYPDRGALGIAPFITWLKVNHAYGLMGEYGVPNTDTRFNVLLNNMIRYMDDNGVSGTYWAGPGFPADYTLGVEPVNGVDRPQMSVLTQY